MPLMRDTSHVNKWAYRAFARASLPEGGRMEERESGQKRRLKREGEGKSGRGMREKERGGENGEVGGRGRRRETQR